MVIDVVIEENNGPLSFCRVKTSNNGQYKRMVHRNKNRANKSASRRLNSSREGRDNGGLTSNCYSKLEYEATNKRAEPGRVGHHVLRHKISQAALHQ